MGCCYILNCVYKMRIRDSGIKKYFDAIFDLRDILYNNKCDFIKSVYIYGSFTRNEIIPDISDIDVMLLVDKNALSKQNLDVISKINETVLEKFNLHMVFRIHTTDEFLSEQTAEDVFYPYLLDLLFFAICIYGDKQEQLFLKCLKNKTLNQVIFETKVVFTNKRNDFFDAYFKDDKYVMADSIYDYYLLLKTYSIDPEIKLEYTLKESDNFENESSEDFLKIFLDLEKYYQTIDFEKMVSLSNKITCGQNNV